MSFTRRRNASSSIGRTDDFSDLTSFDNAEVNALLEQAGTSSADVARVFFDVAAGAVARNIDERRGGLKSHPPRFRDDGDELVSYATVDLLATQIFTHFRMRVSSDWNEFAWRGTHLAARALRAGEHHGIALQSRIDLLDAAFEAAFDVLHERVTSPECSFDEIWPFLEFFEEISVEAVRDNALAHRFAANYAKCVRALPSPLAQAVFTWGIAEFSERGDSSLTLSKEIAARLGDGEDREPSRCLVALLRESHPSIKLAVPPPDLGPESRLLLATLKRHVSAARLRLQHAVTNADSTLAFPDMMHGEFGELVHILRTGTPLAATFAMAGLQITLRSLGSVIPNEAPAFRKSVVDYVCRIMLDEGCIAKSGRTFLAVEALEGMRDFYRVECAGSLASILSGADARLRQGIMVSMVGAYEAQYAGHRQQDVPRFVWDPERVRFHSPVRKDLDTFSTRIADLATTDHGLRTHLEWANSRWDNWSMEDITAGTAS